MPQDDRYSSPSPGTHGGEFVGTAQNVMNFAQQDLWHKRLFQHSSAFQCVRVSIASHKEDLESGALLSQLRGQVTPMHSRHDQVGQQKVYCSVIGFRSLDGRWSISA